MEAIVRALALRHDSIEMNQWVSRWMQVGLYIIGASFWVDARMGHDSFDTAIYGRIATSIPAEIWAGAMMIGAALCFVGLVNPIKRRLLFAGGLINAVQFLLLAASAICTGGELVIGLFGSIFFAPFYVWLMREGLRHGVE